MKIRLSPLGKCIVVLSMFLYSSASFCQYAPATIYHVHKSSNYFPQDHDSAVTVMPKLIKSNFLYYGFLSSVNQHISFEFDKQMNDDLMIIAQAGVISSGFSEGNNSNNSNSTSIGSTTSSGGGYFEGGVKLFLNPDYTRAGRHGYYTEEGLYLKPEFAVTIFTSTVTTTDYAPSYYTYPPPLTTNSTTYSYAGGAILLCLGAQYMVAHYIMVDFYAGVGMSFSNAYSSNYPFTDNYFSYLVTQNVPLAFTGGINVGIPF